MFEENNVNSTEQEKADQEKGVQNEKTFTQKEVNEIVEKRLSRERKKFTGIIEGRDPRELEIEEREKAVTIKEIKADMRSILSEKGLPPETLELLDYTDKESCVKSINTLEEIVKKAVGKKIEQVIKGGEPLRKAGLSMQELKTDTALKNAFGL